MVTVAVGADRSRATSSKAKNDSVKTSVEKWTSQGWPAHRRPATRPVAGSKRRAASTAVKRARRTPDTRDAMRPAATTSRPVASATIAMTAGQRFDQ
jgi:hypothetical protein